MKAKFKLVANPKIKSVFSLCKNPEIKAVFKLQAIVSEQYVEKIYERIDEVQTHVDEANERIDDLYETKQNKLTSENAGPGISIEDIDGKTIISNTRTSAEWGNITGDIEDQEDLIDYLTSDHITYTNPQYPSMQNLQDAMDKLLYVTPTVSISGGGNYEMGATISPVNLSWTWNKSIASQSLNQGIGSLATNIRSYEYKTPVKNDITFTITGSDGQKTVNASTSIKFYSKRYWGVSAKTELEDSDILNLSQELSSSRTQSRTFDCSGGKYFYFVIRTDYCTGIKFKVGGLFNSDFEVTTRNVTNAQGYTTSYRIYRSGNIQTGSAISVEVL